MHVLTQVEQGRDLGFEASMTKLHLVGGLRRTCGRSSTEILGEDATLDALPDGTDLRPLHAQAMWSRSVTIWGGSSQVQRNVTAERVLGLPR
jgi:alkylation response protein AidB-like acyl-CoA dehydrogenase